MAKQNAEPSLSDILNKPSDKDYLAKVIESQTEDFPDISEVSVSQTYVDPFTVPKWCDQVHFAFAWANIRDDIERQRVIEVGYFKIVNRSSSCIVGKPLERDFRDHGAVERQGMFLVYRPKALDDKLRTSAVLRHGEMVSSVAAGKQGEGYELTHEKSKEDKGGKGIDVYAYEEPGVQAMTAGDLKKP